MRVLLVSVNTEKINMPTVPLGLGLVAAATRAAGHEVAWLDLMFEPDPQGRLRRAIADAEPEVIGLSIRNIDDQNVRAPQFLLEKARPLTAACREASAAPIVLGGAGFSIFPEAALRYLGADYGVRGEGEAVFPRLLAALGRGDDPAALPGVHAAPANAADGAASPAIPCAFARSLDDFPAPAPETWTSARAAGDQAFVPVQSRRGCPNDCSYCSTSLIQGRRIRLREPAAVVRQVEALAEEGFSRLYFVDNSFNIPEAYALELCRGIAALRRPLGWQAILYPEAVGPELVRAMAEAGCREVALGFESGCGEILARMNKRFSPEDVRRTCDLLRAHGIVRRGFLLLGGPGETRDTVARSLEFAASLGLETLRVTVGIRIYPETPLAHLAVQEGIVAPDDDLLHPRFYLSRAVDPWILEAVPEQV